MADQIDPSKMSPEEIAELQKKNCIFCKIVKGEMPAKKIYSDNEVTAVMDIHPAAKGHLLIMPSEHFPILPTIPSPILRPMFIKTKYFAQAIKKAAVTDTVTVFIANGPVAGQQSPHFIYHIIPRERGDALTNFNIPKNPVKEDLIPTAIAQMKQNLAQKMKGIAKVEVKPEPSPEAKPAPVPSEKPPVQPQEQIKEQIDAVQDLREGLPKQPPEITVPKIEVKVAEPKKPEVKPVEIPEDGVVTVEQLADIIESNPTLKRMIIRNPAKLRRKMDEHPKLANMFHGIDVFALSSKLKKYEAMAEYDEQQKRLPDIDDGKADNEKERQPDKFDRHKPEVHDARKSEQHQDEELHSNDGSDEEESDEDEPDLDNIGRIFDDGS